MTTIGFIGAGHIGSQLARLSVSNGYDVVVSNSREPETLSALIEELGPRARAGTALEAARAGELDDESTTTAELLQGHLPTSKVVKAFNHIYAAELTTHGQPAGTKNRRALAIAGDDPAAKATVSRLIDQFGFDTVDAGLLREGWRIQRDTPGYGPRRTAEELRRDLAAARRYAQM